MSPKQLVVACLDRYITRPAARIETIIAKETPQGGSQTIGNRLTGDGTYSYAYDNDGNMVGRTRTSDGQVTTYTWDFRNRLTEVLIKTSTGTTVQDDKFTYDVENRRIGKNTLSGGQSWTLYDRVNAYAEFNSSGSLTYRYLFGNAIDFLLARVDTGGNAMWYLTDKLGSVREDVNPSGSVLDSITYDSYGNILSESSPSNGDRFKFTGREWDSEIADYFYRARYYGPAIGRFISEDPLGFKSGDSNFYRYVFNKVSFAGDPSGEIWPVVVLGIIAIGVVLATPSSPHTPQPGPVTLAAIAVAYPRFGPITPAHVAAGLLFIAGAVIIDYLVQNATLMK
jgi:RHS repeat-associated protein